MKWEDYLVGSVAIYFGIAGYVNGGFNALMCFLLPISFYLLGLFRGKE